MQYRLVYGRFPSFWCQDSIKAKWNVHHNIPEIDTYRAQFQRFVNRPRKQSPRPRDIIDVPGEDDDISDDEDPLPHDLADSDVEDLINDDDGMADLHEHMAGVRWCGDLSRLTPTSVDSAGCFINRGSIGTGRPSETGAYEFGSDHAGANPYEIPWMMSGEKTSTSGMTLPNAQTTETNRTESSQRTVEPAGVRETQRVDREDGDYTGGED
ncbi:hypothetical protein Tco_0145183 [Tanacetum coccineum]